MKSTLTLGALLVANNLSEIAAAGASAQAAARTNLGIGTTGTMQLNYLGLGVARTAGRLQLVSGTTSADGIWFGTDTTVFRAGAGNIRFGGTQTTASFDMGTAAYVSWDNASGGASGIRLLSAGSIEMRSNGTLALILDSSQNATFAGNVLAGGARVVGWSSSSVMRSTADGLITLLNSGETDFSRLQFGGTTNSFPALKRNGNQLQARLADDSSSTSVQMSVLELVSSVVVRAGSGTPEGAVTAVIGSLFLRTDGGASTTLYVKESGVGNTGWVAK